MMMGMNDADLQAFLERISATAIANQAILKCQLSGFPMTTDNVILFVGDFIDPQQPGFAGLISEIEKAIEAVVEMPWMLSASSVDK